SPAAGQPAPGTEPAPDSGSGAAPGPEPAGVASPAPAGPPIVIASVGQLSGIVGQAIGAGTKAVAAWVAEVNQAGGVNGQPVQYLVADDGADPGRHQALVREMVEQRHVVAFVYQLAPLSGSSSVKYLEQKRVPVVGSEAASPWFDTSPMFFEQSTQGSLAAVPMLGAAAFYGSGKTKVGLVVCAEGVAICEDAKRTLPEWDTKFGLEVVQVQTASMAQPDYTAECLSLRNAGAELMAFIGDANSLIRLARSCGNAGFRPQFFFAQQQSQNQFLSEPLLEGAAGDALTAPWFLSSSPAVAEFQAALRRYAPGTAPDGQTSFGWAAAKLFERAAASVSGPITSDALLDALWSLRGETLGGFTMPLSFQPDRPNPQKVCFNPIRIEKGRFTSADNGAFRCVG
ncbi:MAG: ABC transporter substrate-binding protein, partial [Acidimicrobiia bacterium]